jgi:hypothetical protein
MEGGIDGGLRNGGVEEDIVEPSTGSGLPPPSDEDERAGFEQIQMQHFRELDMEQLEVEDIDYDSTSILSDDDSRCFHQYLVLVFCIIALLCLLQATCSCQLVWSMISSILRK